ncbi:hypothetical protein CR513_21229, partial [Mucuna pruriens]
MDKRLVIVSPRLSQFDSVVSKFVLSRDRVGFVSVETKPDQSLPRASNTHHFDNRGSTTSRGMHEIADNRRFEGYIDGCGIFGTTVSTKYHADSAKQHAVSTKYHADQQNNMQFQQNVISTMQELIAHIGQLATTINQLQFEDSGQVPSQAIPNPQENISDITMRSDMELSQQ